MNPESPEDGLSAETLRRVDQLCAAFRAEVLRLLATMGRRPREVRAIARLEGKDLAPDSHVERRDYPLEGS